MHIRTNRHKCSYIRDIYGECSFFPCKRTLAVIYGLLPFVWRLSPWLCPYVRVATRGEGGISARLKSVTPLLGPENGILRVCPSRAPRVVRVRAINSRRSSQSLTDSSGRGRQLHRNSCSASSRLFTPPVHLNRRRYRSSFDPTFRWLLPPSFIKSFPFLVALGNRKSQLFEPLGGGRGRKILAPRGEKWRPSNSP